MGCCTKKPRCKNNLMCIKKILMHSIEVGDFSFFCQKICSDLLKKKSRNLLFLCCITRLCFNHQASECKITCFVLSVCFEAQVIYHIGKKVLLSFLLSIRCTSFPGSDTFDLLNTRDGNGALFIYKWINFASCGTPIFHKYNSLCFLRYHKLNSQLCLMRYRNSSHNLSSQLYLTLYITFKCFAYVKFATLFNVILNFCAKVTFAALIWYSSFSHKLNPQLCFMQYHNFFRAS